MQVRHNTSLLEQAVAYVVARAEIPLLQAEAAAFDARQRAIATRRWATGGAIAIAAVGIGLGLNFAYPHFLQDWFAGRAVTPPSESASSETSSIASSLAPVSSLFVPAASSLAELSEVSVAPAGPVGPVTSDYSKFQQQQISQFGKTWNLETGHHYATNTDENWDYAWCYVKQVVDGVSINIELVDRRSNVAPRALVATHETLVRAGLSDADALTLATFCPWADQAHFAAKDFKLDRPFIPGDSAAAAEGATVPTATGAGSKVAADPSSETVTAAGAFVQFGSFASLLEADGELEQSQARWGSYLQGSTMTVQTVGFGASDIRYNLRAQFPTIEQARMVCSIIAARGGDCFARAY